MSREITSNTKFMGVCWTCGGHQEVKDWNGMPDGKGIKCEKCGGFIVSPYGKTQGYLAPTVKIFLIEDGEMHHIAAKDEEEARKFYSELYDEELDPDETVTEITDPSEWQNKFITTDDGANELLSLIDAVNDCEKFPALLCSSVF